MSKYKIHQVYVSAGTTETLAIDYEHTTDELYFWAFPDAHQSARDVLHGSIESWMNAGKCIAVGKGEYKFFGAFSSGYTVFVARKSEADTEPKQKPYNAFPLATLLQAISELIKRSQEDAEEILRALRTPEANSKMILPMALQRAGKLLGFNDDGEPAVGEDCKQFSQMMNAQKTCESYVKQAEKHAQIAGNHVDTAQKLASDASDSADEAETSATEAKKHAREAQGWHQKAESIGTQSIEAVGLLVGAAEHSATDAEASAIRAEEAMNRAVSGVGDIDKKLCYIGCAAKEVREAVANFNGYAENVEGSKNAAEEAAQDARKSERECENYAKQLSRTYKYCGTVSAISELPTTGNNVGDVYNVAQSGLNYAWDGSNWDCLAGDIFLTKSDLESGVETQTIFGFDPVTGKKTKSALYMSDIPSVMSNGKEIMFPDKAGTLSTKEELSEALQDAKDSFDEKGDEILENAKKTIKSKIPFLKTVPPTANNNANCFGYRGNLRNLGAYGGSIFIGELSILKRASNNQNTNIDLWARVLKVSEGNWVIAAQSKEPRKWDDVENGTVLTWEMESVEGVAPPSADEEVAIVWVNAEDATPETSNGVVSFQTISVPGGLQYALPASPATTSGLASWSPWISLKFIPMDARDGVPSLQSIFEKHPGGNINVGAARTFITSPVDGGYFSGVQLSDFASRFFAASPDGSMNGFIAHADSEGVFNRVFGAPLQLSHRAENPDEAVCLGQLNELLSQKADKTTLNGILARIEALESNNS